MHILFPVHLRLFAQIAAKEITDEMQRIMRHFGWDSVTEIKRKAQTIYTICILKDFELSFDVQQCNDMQRKCMASELKVVIFALLRCKTPHILALNYISPRTPKTTTLKRKKKNNSHENGSGHFRQSDH